jgi:DNA polymerase-3 subunit delta
MPEITYKDFEKHLKKVPEEPEGTLPQVYLFHGEELLYKKAFASFVEKMIPPEDRSVNCEPVDGAPENIRDAVNRANTYSMLSGNKVIAVQETRIFYGKKEQGKLLEKAEAAIKKEDRKKASKFLMGLLGELKMRPEDIRDPEDVKALLDDGDDLSDTGWIVELAGYCVDNAISAPGGGQPDQFLENAVLKGFPPGNFMALTTDVVDRRKTLFKTIREKGVVVDCSVPKGNRKADRIVQEEVLKNRIASILGGSKKKLMPQAFTRLYDLTGFELRTFSNNLEKLVLYVGDRDVITPDDVTAVLERSKQDPIYELTGAVSDRDAAKALMLMDSLLQAGMHYLQVFTAIVNQVRKLIRIKSFMLSPQGRAWQNGMPYNAFTARALTAMEDYDRNLKELYEKWNETLTQDPTRDGEKKKGKKKAKALKVPTDILSAPNPKNPYPIYLTLKKADNFKMEELTELYAHLANTDIRLKRSAQDPKIVLEETILKICRPRK